MTRTIYALSSGRPPAAIAVVRISGPDAQAACVALAGAVPPPRRASLRRLRDATGATLDQALTLFFPGPDTATGEDLVEFHLHGGRAVVAAVEAALSTVPGLSAAEPGAFTRRALENGRLDLAQTEGLADLLEAETEMQRRAALAIAEGGLSQQVAGWLDRLSTIAAQVEAELDFSDEGDVADAVRPAIANDVAALIADLDAALARPPVERLRDGMTVVLAGPRNAGKSSLFNALLERDAAIVTPIAGTTRDILEAAVVRAGLPFRLIDTAGLVDDTDDTVEAIGIARARGLLRSADVILWLGVPAEAPTGATVIHARSDIAPPPSRADYDIMTSMYDPASIAALWSLLTIKAETLIGAVGDVPLHKRHRALVSEAVSALRQVAGSDDLLLDAEHLRIASRHLSAIMGRDATEAMLDALFSRFCVGK